MNASRSAVLWGNPGGIRLEHDGTPAEVTRPEDADIFMTGPVIPSDAIWDRCSSSYHDPNATTYTLHVPGGAVCHRSDRLSGRLGA